MKRVFLFMVVLIIPSCVFAEEKTDHVYSARTRVYAYVMGGNFHLTPTGAWMGGGGIARDVDGFMPTMGVGFSLVEMGQRLFLNLEADYTFSSLEMGGFAKRSADTWAIMLQAEYRIKSRFSLYGGMGVGILRQWRDPVLAPGEAALVEEALESTLAWAFGTRIAVSRHLMFRAAVRIFSILYPYDDREYWVDSLGVRLSDYESELYATSFMAGLEFHF